MTSSYKDTTVVVNASVNSDLWHCRLGYMSEQKTKVLLSKGKLLGWNVKHSLCEAYSFSKQKEVRHSKV